MKKKRYIDKFIIKEYLKNEIKFYRAKNQNIKIYTNMVCNKT